jgi:parallel beta-helix repeat protein
MSNVVIRDNFISNTVYDGILIDYSKNVIVYSNTIYSNLNCINIESSELIACNKNSLNGIEGITIDYSSQNIIIKDNFFYFNIEGIYIYRGNSILIQDNIFINTTINILLKENTKEIFVFDNHFINFKDVNTSIIDLGFNNSILTNYYYNNNIQITIYNQTIIYCNNTSSDTLIEIIPNTNTNGIYISNVSQNTPSFEVISLISLFLLIIKRKYSHSTK